MPLSGKSLGMAWESAAVKVGSPSVGTGMTV